MSNTQRLSKTIDNRANTFQSIRVSWVCPTCGEQVLTFDVESGRLQSDAAPRGARCARCTDTSAGVVASIGRKR